MRPAGGELRRRRYLVRCATRFRDPKPCRKQPLMPGYRGYAPARTSDTASDERNSVTDIYQNVGERATLALSRMPLSPFETPSSVAQRELSGGRRV